MGREAVYAGDAREKTKYRQRVHQWRQRGLLEGTDYTVEHGVPILLRTPPPRPQRREQPPPSEPDTRQLLTLPDESIIQLPYAPSVIVTLLRRKWELSDATSGGATHPVDQLPPLPSDLKEDLRYYGDLIAAYYSKEHPHPYGTNAD